MVNLGMAQQSKLMVRVRNLDPDKSKFTVIGKGRVVSKRAYRADALMEHLLTHALAGLTIEEIPEELRWLYSRIPKTSWCSPGCAMKVFNQHNCPSNIGEVKRRVASACIAFLKDGVYILKEYGKHGELEAWKIFDESSEADRVWGARQVEVAREKRERYLDKMEAIVYGSAQPEPPGQPSAGIDGSAGTIQ